MLPPDVWSHVASFLSVKDVARLSGEEFDIFNCLARPCHHQEPSCAVCTLAKTEHEICPNVCYCCRCLPGDIEASH